ncbi:unnamed protein product [Linum tenue]|uniref:PRLI-interacting factor A n=1 Tax=Linum tenue TaxID=586396 RepID=A0AAV0L3V8_9ROSI|nr:unnamed protein product [Linum tenue]
MNDQAQQMMNQPQMMGGGSGRAGPVMNPLPTGPPIMSQAPPPPVMAMSMGGQTGQLMNPVQVQPQMMNPTNQPQQMLSHGQVMSQQMMMKNQQRGYNPWPPQQNQQQQQLHPGKFGYFVPPSKPRTGNNNWKGKNKDRRMGKPMSNNISNNNSNISGGGSSLTGSSGGGVGGASYIPPSLNELQNQNRMKTQKHYHHNKKKYNNRYAPYAPRNSTSFIIRAKKSGGIASLVSPCPVTPAVLPTPDIEIHPMEVLGDVAKEEWGVDGYGSMKGLIRLRSPGHEVEVNEDDEEDEGSGSSESDVEEHVEVERRLDHDLSRFEMIYPSNAGGEYSYNNLLENRVDDQDTHIAHLEEENLTLKERMFLMERELDDLRRRMQFLERHHHHHHGQGNRSGRVMGEVNEEILENVSENDLNESESHGESDGLADNKEMPKMELADGHRECSNDENNVNENSREDVKSETNDICMLESGDEVVEKKEVKCEEGRDPLASDALVANKEEPRDNVRPEKVTAKEEVTALGGDCHVKDIIEDTVDGGSGQVQVVPCEAIRTVVSEDQLWSFILLDVRSSEDQLLAFDASSPDSNFDTAKQFVCIRGFLILTAQQIPDLSMLHDQ